SDAFTIDKIVAVVNNEVIVQCDLNRAEATLEAEYMSIYPESGELSEKLKQGRQNILNQMIEEKLVLSEAKRYEVEVEQALIDERIERIGATFPNQQMFEQALEEQGLTLKDLSQRFYEQEMMKKTVDFFVRATVEVEPQEIKLFYRSHQSELVRPKQAKLKYILIKADGPENERQALKKAKRVLERLKQGEDFAELVELYSQGENLEQGGDLGFIEQGQLIQAIDKAIFSLAPGEFTDALRTPAGYRIFKVEQIKPEVPLSFAEAQELVKKILYEEEFAKAFKKWIAELRQDAHIVIKNE
ncbi:MAG: peptidylprolyl isomerase, partial [Candidatus Omnitrophica bacterium]|nr:peptidylprolyl isomerase [Candidatus Omnitrophota bacterium]